jgi:hypothetical protein
LMTSYCSASIFLTLFLDWESAACPVSPVMILDGIHFRTMKWRMQQRYLHHSWTEHSATDGESRSISNTQLS